MSEMKIVATIRRSDGNSEVGEMWSETAVFDSDVTLLEVYKWAGRVLRVDQEKSIRRDIVLSVAQ